MQCMIMPGHSWAQHTMVVEGTQLGMVQQLGVVCGGSSVPNGWLGVRVALTKFALSRSYKYL